MGTKTFTQDEPVLTDIVSVVIGGRSSATDPGEIIISYITRDNAGNVMSGHKTVSVPFSSLTAGQKTTLRNVMNWALARVVTEEGPFI